MGKPIRYTGSCVESLLGAWVHHSAYQEIVEESDGRMKAIRALQEQVTGHDKAIDQIIAKINVVGLKVINRSLVIRLIRRLRSRGDGE